MLSSFLQIAPQSDKTGSRIKKITLLPVLFFFTSEALTPKGATVAQPPVPSANDPLGSTRSSDTSRLKREYLFLEYIQQNNKQNGNNVKQQIPILYDDINRWRTICLCTCTLKLRRSLLMGGAGS